MHQTNDNEIKIMKQLTEQQHMALSLPTFDGSVNQDSEEWLMKIKYILQQENIPADKFFKTIVCHLQGPAFKWFYRRQNEISDLETFEEKLLEQYPVHDVNDQKLNQQLNNSCQDSNYKNVPVKSKEVEPIQQRQSTHQSSQLKRSSSSEDGQPIINHSTNQSTKNSIFSGGLNEEAGEWIDKMLTLIEQQKLTSSEQRDLAAQNLRGEALRWYRMNRLKIPDIQSFVHEFLLNFSHSQSSIPDISSLSNDILLISDSPRHVLQSAKNEKVKLLSNFTGSENSFNWLQNLQQTGTSLKLNDQQIYELGTIKLIGPAQEWFYDQDQSNEINDWISFKEALLQAFPSPIQPTNIDYLYQLLSRKQGENESVSKFAQDINRLCLKLDNKVSEQEKLQFLQKGLRPQLKHYALQITSIQDFLTTMQQHEQIEKEKTLNQSLSSPFGSSFRAAKSSNSYSTALLNSHSNVISSISSPNTDPPQHPHNSFNRTNTNYYDSKQNHHVNPPQDAQSTAHHTVDKNQYQNSDHHATPPQQRNNHNKCYLCNKPGHLQQNCPEAQPSSQQNFQYDNG